MIRTRGFSKEDIEDHFYSELRILDSESIEIYLHYYDMLSDPDFKEAFLRVFRDVQEYEDVLQSDRIIIDDPQEASEGKFYNFLQDLSDKLPGGECITYSWLYDFASYMLLFFRDELDIDELYNRALHDVEQGLYKTTFTLR